MNNTILLSRLFLLTKGCTHLGAAFFLLKLMYNQIVFISKFFPASLIMINSSNSIVLGL